MLCKHKRGRFEWCLCVAEPGGDYCAIHKAHPGYKAQEPDAPTPCFVFGAGVDGRGNPREDATPESEQGRRHQPYGFTEE